MSTGFMQKIFSHLLLAAMASLILAWVIIPMSVYPSNNLRGMKLSNKYEWKRKPSDRF
jgi:hypothetical protein